MSALDQAFIKAYSKDSAAITAPAATAAVTAQPSVARNSGRTAAAAVRRAGGQHVEQLYRDGSLYRVETPRAIAGTAGQAAPPPHIAMLPPTSPRRGVRRSVLRLLANQPATPAPEAPVETPQRVARKVIIRHVSHNAPPAPRGRLRATLTQSFATDTETLVEPKTPAPSGGQAELTPETIADQPSAPSPVIPPLSSPAPLAVPAETPLNSTAYEMPQFAVHGYWQQGEAAPATFVVSDAANLSALAGEALVAAPLVTVSLDALIAAEQAIRQQRLAEQAVAEYEPSMQRFAGKSFDDHEHSPPSYRVDAEHGRSHHRPHARFRPAEGTEEVATPAVENDTALPTIAVPDETVAEAEGIDIEIVESATEQVETVIDLTFAESAHNELTLLDEAAAEERAEPSLEQIAPTAAPRAAPLWEIDRFQWPRTCQKLFADEHGYLAGAGSKLLAAVQDGLKVLAVTGSRRGEGRSTLALCLARAAAEAGVQVALMDADFARPQIASKIGLEIAFGWQDAALGKIPLSEAAVKSLADNITVLPLETSAAGKSLSLADPRVTATVRAASATFELLILDLGPIAPGEELAFPPGERCPLDAAIVVRDLRFATATESEDIGRQLQDAGVEAVGIAENFVMEEELPATSV